MSDANKVTIKPATGRPMLTWVGKRPLRQVTTYPTQHGEAFTPRPDWQADPAVWAGGRDG